MNVATVAPVADVPHGVPFPHPCRQLQVRGQGHLIQGLYDVVVVVVVVVILYFIILHLLIFDAYRAFHGFGQA